MSKISTYLGLRKDATTAENPNKQSYGTALFASGFLAVLILIDALANHPAQGIPSHLYGYLPGVNGGGNWITSEGLGALPVALAWATYYYWYALLLTVALGFALIANRALRQGAFTQSALSSLKRLNLGLGLGYAIYLTLDLWGSHLIASGLGADTADVPSLFARPEILPVYLAFTAVGFTLGLLDRGAVLQEDAEATI